MPRTSDLTQLKYAAQESTSLAQVLRHLGLSTAAPHYKSLQKLIRENNIDVSHFKGQGHNKGKTWVATPIEKYLSNEVKITSHKLRIRLIKEGILVAECSRCKGTEWQGSPIPLQLDHINGNHEDNALANLRLLCPNCHALTANYCGKAARKPKKICSCGNAMHKKASCCIVCFRQAKAPRFQPQKTTWTSKEEPPEMLNILSCSR